MQKIELTQKWSLVLGYGRQVTFEEQYKGK